MTTTNPNPASLRWFYANAENQSVGPVTLAELHQFASSGQISPQTFVIQEGGSDWLTYADVAPKEHPIPNLPPPVPNMQSPKARRWPAVVCTIILYPFGLIALWLSKGYTKSQKLTLTGASIGVFVLSLLAGKPPIFAVLVVNSVLFIWWARSLSKVWRIVLCVLVSIIFLPPVFLPREYISERSDMTDRSVEVPSPLIRSDGPAGTSKPQEDSVKKVGETFRLGDFSYRILGSRDEGYVGRPPLAVEAGLGGRFLIVRYSVTNESNKTRTVVSDDFILRDGKGREYRPAAKALTALLSSEENKDFLLSELQPGLQHVTSTAFEVPTQSIYGDGSLTLIVPEKGWGGKRVEVLLKKNK